MPRGTLGSIFWLIIYPVKKFKYTKKERGLICPRSRNTLPTDCSIKKDWYAIQERANNDYNDEGYAPKHSPT
jgi:hypothetical protein